MRLVVLGAVDEARRYVEEARAKGIVGFVPTGIGSGPHCGGQVLVSYDAFGFTEDAAPKFVRQYARLGAALVAAAKEYAADVQEGRYPAA